MMKLTNNWSWKKRLGIGAVVAVVNVVAKAYVNKVHNNFIKDIRRQASMRSLKLTEQVDDQIEETNAEVDELVNDAIDDLAEFEDYIDL